MATDRARAANRRNARASTGPRTEAGKTRSSQNARKHGLSATGTDQEMEAEVSRLAALIASELPAEERVIEAAHAIAAAHGHLQRVRSLKTEMMRGELAMDPGESAPGQPASPPPPELLQQLEQLERYERRALSRRKSAVRHLTRLLQTPERS